MTHSLQQLTEQMAKGFASVTTMQTTVASLTEQLQQERQHSAALSKQVSKLEDNLSKLTVTVSGILNQATNFAPPAFTPEIFQTILEQALGSFAEGFVNASSQASSAQSSPQPSPRTPTRSLSPSSAQAFTPQSKRLRRNESDLAQCEQHMDNFRGDLPPIDATQETLTKSATTAFDYVLNEWDDDSPQASLSMQVRLDQLNQPDDGALKSVSPVVLTTTDNSSLTTITDSSVPAPATQPACGTPSQPPFSPVARNTRQKKPITQAPQAPVDKQWAGGKH
jgi:hypothetical protein